MKPAYVRELRSLGLNPSVCGLVEKRVLGVTDDHVHRMGKLGQEGFTLNRLSELRIHGETPGYVREMESPGLNGLTPDRLVDIRIHGADTGYVPTMKKIV